MLLTKVIKCAESVNGYKKTVDEQKRKNEKKKQIKA